ncbi:MAG: HAMP domain-containing histidine kinase [Lachnospiraceae bacterium]|nr:HAMP domain-containing histidine kinase [Lachnospiraceae bacterium]
MEAGTLILTGALALLVGLLLLKIHLLHRAARELGEAFRDRLAEDTNILVDTGSHDPYMRSLASEVNAGLRALRRDRRRFRQGDMELKDAVTHISHDLRTPLTAICGYLDLLKKEPLSESSRRYLSVIEERTEVLKQLTEELFRYSITASFGNPLHPEEVSLNGALEESLCAYYGVFQGCQITPGITMPEREIFRSLDKSALGRILSNILSNAVKYSDGDLTVRLLPTGEMVFQNHASGLTEVEVSRLFDRYYTVENAKRSTGLGLSIARILTEQMGGSIGCEFREGVLSIRLLFP